MITPISNVPGPKVKLVAIAKDEGAYIPEWVFHHLYLGFDAIDVYVNRTTDNSLAMLDAISQFYPQVKGHSADWVDQCPEESQNNLQYIIYAKAFYEAKKSGEFDYVLFLDIDEFWTPKSMRTSVQEVIAKYPEADTISFQWINEFGKDEVFQPLRRSLDGRINPLVKTLIKVSAEVTKHRFHFPELKDGQSVLVDGDKFRRDPNVREGLHKDLRHLRPVMIIHRAFRSPMEYVSLLNRGRPSGELQIKLNRGGYNECTGREVLFELNEKYYAKYRDALAGFLSHLQIEDLLNSARDFVKNRYEQTLNYLPNVPRMYFVDLFRVFKGCTDYEYSRLTEAIVNSPRLKRCKNPDELIELAKEIDKVNIHVAHVIWKQALEHRPKGPLIKTKIREYLEQYGSSVG